MGTDGEEPQWLASEEVSTQTPLHLWEAGGQTQLPEMQDPPAPQAFPHPPQLSGLMFELLQVMRWPWAGQLVSGARHTI